MIQRSALKMSKTPRTDAVEAAFLANGMTPSPGLLDHARKLECELASALSENKRRDFSEEIVYLRRLRDVLAPPGGTMQPMTEEQRKALDDINDRIVTLIREDGCYAERHRGTLMTLREWLAIPVMLLSDLAEDGGEWLAQKLHELAKWIAGHSGDKE
jgi:hypothetical protein